MKLRVLIVSLFFVIFSVGYSLGQIDPDPDGVGVYFDEEATVVSAISDAYAYVNAYLILTNPSETGGIVFWSAYLDFWNPSGYYQGPAYINGEPRYGTNNANPLPGSYYCVFSVDIDFPQPFFPITILADLEFKLRGEVNPLNIYLSRVLYSTIGVWGPYVSPTPSSGSIELPVASINGPAPVAVENRSWGEVKALFRY